MLNMIVGLNVAAVLLLFFLCMRQLLQKSQQERANQLFSLQIKEELVSNLNHIQQALIEKMAQSRLEQSEHSAALKEQLQQAFANHRARFDERQLDTLKILQDTLTKGVQDNRQQVKEALTDYAKELGKRVDQLTQTTETKLKVSNSARSICTKR